MLENLPNLDCCYTDNPNDLCDECRAAYIAANRRLTENERQNDFLPLPGDIFGEQRREQRSFVASVPGDASPLMLPETMAGVVAANQAERGRNRRTTRPNHIATTTELVDDFLPLPSMNWEK